MLVECWANVGDSVPTFNLSIFQALSHIFWKIFDTLYHPITKNNVSGDFVLEFTKNIIAEYNLLTNRVIYNIFLRFNTDYNILTEQYVEKIYQFSSYTIEHECTIKVMIACGLTQIIRWCKLVLSS